MVYCLGANADKLQERVEITVEIGKGAIKAVVVSSPELREHGMMKRKYLDADSGMLFVLDAPEAVCLWMKDTLIPLSAAFIDDSKQVVQTIDLEPNSEELQCASVPIRYILEVNQHWFEQNDVRAGSKVDMGTEKP